jgi:NADPH2:quinone reductase
MRAIEIHRWCNPEELVVRQVSEPVCGPEEVRIRVHAASVSYSLSLLVAGRYQRKPTLPFVPGNTAAGEVIAVGSDVRRLRIGDRVLASVEQGALAEQVVAHQDIVYAVPARMPFAEATTLNASYNSVAAALTWPHLLDVRPGQSMLVTGAAGGVGVAAIQIGRLLGAKVIAVASTPAKREFALQQGADHALAADPAGLRDAVWQAHGGPVQRAIEPVGGAVFQQVLRCMAPEGRVLPIGFACGEIPQIQANLLLVKNITVCGLYMGYYKIDARTAYAERMRALFGQLGHWWEEGKIRPTIAGRYPLENVPAAFAQVLNRTNVGHVVIEIA